VVMVVRSECELITLESDPSSSTSSSSSRSGDCDISSSSSSSSSVNDNNNHRSRLAAAATGWVVPGRGHHRGALVLFRGGGGGLSGSGLRTSWLAACLLLLATLLVQAATPADAIDPVSTLECHRRQYTYKVHKTDDSGRNCWDNINVMSCWGRCDSNEIADWKFPFKRTHHPVCMHRETKLTEVVLRNCDEDADPGTEIYTFHEAAACACTVCKSNEASCEGLRYRGARRAPSRRSPSRRSSLVANRG
ncbi:unnamed protein product, partial [Meganyctiphanes norvegica]